MPRLICFLLSVAVLNLAIVTRANETVTFTARLPQVGQQGLHDVKFVLDMAMTLQQGKQVVSSQQQTLTRVQQRDITVLKTAGDTASMVKVHYRKANETTTRSTQTGALRTQPIEGRSYIVERRGEALVIADPAGQPVAEEEQKLVAAGMDSVGRPNPMSKFLHGKQLTVGQKLALPNGLATELLGLRQTGGETQKVELTLRGIRLEEDRRVADFVLLVTMKLGGGGTLDIHGDLGLDIDTCQVTSANFTGPVSLAETHGPKGGEFQVVSEGTITANIRSRHINLEEANLPPR